MDQTVLSAIARQLDQRISDNTLRLPMLPQITSEVLSLVNDVDSDAAALSKLIQSDQALAGHVMRIANSAAYSPSAKMSSLQQAIARLGMQNITEIAMAASMGPKMFAAPGFEDLIQELWVFSLATAVWAREIAREGRRNVESTFLCGLLFQIGKPVVLQAALEIAQSFDLALDIEQANELLNRYQMPVGIQLAERWLLPAAVADTIRHVDAEAAGSSKDIVDTIRAARVFAAMTMADRQYDKEALITDPLVIEVNLYAEDVQHLLDKAEQVHDTIGALTL